MAMKEQQRSVYRTMQGREIDMHKLVMQNEMAVAVGNARVNARGDELGPGGKIIRKREDILKEAQNAAPNQVRSQREEPELSPVITPATISTPSTPPVVSERYNRKKVDDMDPAGEE